VSRRLAAHGALVIDADLLAREVVEPGTDGLAEVVAEFGPSVVGGDGGLDRTALAERVFADADARRRLERIVHPRVRMRAAELERTAPPDAVVVHDIPLLVETGRAGDFDVVVVVDLDEAEQVRRLVDSRGITAEEARARIQAQATRAERVAAADVVVDNSGTPDDLDAAVADLWRALRQRDG
jgi:dephospho-CoA kinase